MRHNLSNLARGLIAGIIFLAMVTGGPPARAVTCTITWAEPTEGTPVVYYVVQIATDGGAWVEVGRPAINTLVWDFESNRSYLCRVQGVDANGNEGPWSPLSDVWLWPAPGGCGKPTVSCE